MDAFFKSPRRNHRAHSVDPVPVGRTGGERVRGVVDDDQAAHGRVLGGCGAGADGCVLSRRALEEAGAQVLDSATFAFAFAVAFAYPFPLYQGRGLLRGLYDCAARLGSDSVLFYPLFVECQVRASH